MSQAASVASTGRSSSSASGSGSMPNANPNDPWNLTSNTYDPDKFYTRATDGNGHDTVIQVKISPALLGQLQHITESRQIPEYRTRADIVRDALIHRMRYLADNYAGTVNLHDLEIEQRQAELDKLKVQRAAWVKYLADLDQQLKDLIEQGELDEADWLIDANEWNESMTPPYLKKLLEIITKHRNQIKRMTKL